MWRMKPEDGKDRPKKSDGSWAFPSSFEGHYKTAKLTLEMTEPIHDMGKIVSMDSGFLCLLDFWQCILSGCMYRH